MIVAAGDILEVTGDNPDVGIIAFSPMSGEENTLDIGGIRGDDNAAVTASGTLVNSYKRVVGKSSIMVASNETETAEYEKACAIAASTKETTWTVGMLNGTVYKANGVLQGDLELNLFKGTFTLKIISGLGFVKQ